MRAISDLSTLIEWVKERGVTVVFGNTPRDTGATLLQEQNIIKMSSRYMPEKQLFTLLHECGHMLIGERRKHERYGMGYKQEHHPIVSKTLHHRFDVLDEEMEAWFRGLRLARRLKIRVNKEAFHAHRLKCLKTYVKWVLEPEEFETEEAA